MQFDVNLNATIEVDDKEFEALVDSMREYDGQDAETLVADGVAASIKAANKLLNDDEKAAEDKALTELADSIDGEELSSVYGRAWVCSVDTPTRV